MSMADKIAAELRTVIRLRLGLELAGTRPEDLGHAAARIGELFPAIPLAALPARLIEIGTASPEWASLVDLLTVGETYFFRDAAWFEAFEAHVLLPLIAERRRAADLRLRLWSAGCATGEEAYSLAITLARLLPDRAAWSIHILATDVNPRAIEVARRGLYRPWSFRQVPDHIVERYFVAEDGQRRLDPAIRGMVAFSTQNLVDGLDAAPPAESAEMDIVLCRNVLMYFASDMQRLVSERLSRSLATGGWILTASAEAWSDLFPPLAKAYLPGLVGFRATGGEAVPSFAAAPSLPPPTPVRRRDRRPGLYPVPTARAASPAMSRPDMLARARALADGGDYAEARALCEQALAGGVADYDGHLLHAQVCQELGDRVHARRALRRALYLHPESMAAHFLLGNLCESEGDHGAALRSMRNVVELGRRAVGAPTEETSEASWRLVEAALSFLEQRGEPSVAGGRPA